MAGKPHQKKRVTQTMAARLLGCSVRTIRRYVANSLIDVGDDRLIDIDEARRVLLARQAGASPESIKAGASPKPGRSPDGGEEHECGVYNYDAERARKEAALASLRELELAEKRGELIRADTVEHRWTRIAEATRRAVLNVPARLAWLGHEQRVELDRELREALGAAADEIEEIALEEDDPQTEVAEP